MSKSWGKIGTIVLVVSLLCTTTMPMPVSADGGVITGQVVDPNGSPLSDVEVTIPTDGETITTSTDANGRFRFNLSDRSLPSRVFVVASKPGFMAESVLATTSGDSVTIELQSGGQQAVGVGSGFYHVGDDSYSGTINSRFQTSAIGETVDISFTLNDVQTAADSATLVFDARGVQHANRLSINGRQIGTTAQSPEDGSLSQQRISFDPAVLRPGENTLTIEGVETGGWFSSDVDDFELSDIQIQLGGVPPDEQSPTVSTTAADVVLPESAPNIEVSATDNHRIAIVSAAVVKDGETVAQRVSEEPSFTFEPELSEPGEYRITVQATDQSGNVETQTDSIAVQNAVVTGLYTMPARPVADGTTDIVAIASALEPLSGDVPVELRVDGETVATKTLSGLEEGETTINWSDVTFASGERDVSVVIDPADRNDALIGSPSKAITTNVHPVEFEEFHSSLITPEAGETVISAGNTHTVIEVSNPTDSAVTGDFQLRVDGQEVDTATDVTIDADERRRLMFAWSSDVGHRHDVTLTFSTDSGTYTVENTFARQDGTISEAIPSEVVQVETNDNIPFDVRATLFNILAEHEAGSDEVDRLHVPIRVTGETAVSVTVETPDGEVLGSAEKTVTSDDQYVTVPLEEHGEYAVITVKEQGSAETFIKEMGLSITGGSALASFQETGRMISWDPTYYHNSLTYRAVLVAELSGYPESSAFEDLQNRVDAEEDRRMGGSFAVDAIGTVSSAADITKIERASLATDFVTNADSNLDLDLDELEVEFDADNPRVASHSGIAKVTSYEMEQQPGYVSQSTSGSGRTAMRYLDVKATGLADGDAELEVEYDNELATDKNLKEASLELHYWKDGEWQTADDLEVDPADDTITGEIPVSDLTGTPILIDGVERNTFEQAVFLFTTSFGGVLPSVVGALLLGGLVAFGYRRRSGSDGDREGAPATTPGSPRLDTGSGGPSSAAGRLPDEETRAAEEQRARGAEALTDANSNEHGGASTASNPERGDGDDSADGEAGDDGSNPWADDSPDKSGED